ncbi:hypothetical protein [Azospirillum halopraeferens]|uniref:hypothetical protein n=1 Tax=Azospirillum halopraeferens TaxID=34010 RepID=UPI00040BD10F|nr:hypothetical protein [Azospirillum halopraeferens]
MNRVMRAAAVAGLPVLVLAACATGAEDAALVQRAQTTMVGMPKAHLLSCAGVPERQAVANGTEYYTYVAPPAYGRGGPSTSIGVAGGSSGGVGVGVGLGFPLFGGGGGARGGCQANVTLQGDVVRGVTYPAGAYLPDCAPILRNCVAPAPAAR